MKPKQKPEKLETLKTISLKVEDYLAVKGLLHCINMKINLSRPSINLIFYNPKRDEFVATDGHIMRVQKVEWPNPDKKPKRGFFIRVADFLHTASSLKLAELYTTTDIPIHYLPDDYPNYPALLRKREDSAPVSEFSFDLDLIVRFRKSFPGEAPVVIFRPGKTNIQGFQIYRGNEFLGIIMPVKIKDD